MRARAWPRHRNAGAWLGSGLIALYNEYFRFPLLDYRLSGGVAVIKVGAPSEAEMKSRKEALEDAISATKAAVAEGVVPGGGLALLRAIGAMESEEAKSEGDERTEIGRAHV